MTRRGRSRSVETLSAEWDEMTNLDAMWAVLSDPSKRNDGWEHSEFWATGVRDVAGMLTGLEALGWASENRRALDFGCGLGRLSAPLAAHFDDVVGVDISQAMVSRARQEHAAVQNLEFHQLATGDLAMFDDESFDLVATAVVLQHQVSSDAVLGYVEEFCRIVAPGGVLVFDVPTHLARSVSKLRLRRVGFELGRRLGLPAKLLHGRFGLTRMTMTMVELSSVEAVLERAGLAVLQSDNRLAGNTYVQYITASKPCAD